MPTPCKILVARECSLLPPEMRAVVCDECCGEPAAVSVRKYTAMKSWMDELGVKEFSGKGNHQQNKDSLETRFRDVMVQ